MRALKVRFGPEADIGRRAKPPPPSSIGRARLPAGQYPLEQFEKTVERKLDCGRQKK
jgi:hypothetical protein